MKKYLFIDRDGTLIVEPPNYQVDHIDQLYLMPHVIPSLLQLQQSGYCLVMITNQDGLGSASYPQENFDVVQDYLMQLLTSQGIFFDAVHVCPHLESDGCWCRKPAPGLVLNYLSSDQFDQANSYVIGDRSSDMELARIMGISGLLIDSTITMDWQQITRLILGRDRIAMIERCTTETTISCYVNLDADEDSHINTGISFFDHMLYQLAKHAGICLKLEVSGDLHVDDHHTIEDVGIVLGQILKKALADKVGIARYGFVLPMDDAKAMITLDLGGRSYLKFDGKFTRETIGDLSTEMIKHFFKSFCDHLQAVLHIDFSGENTHHMIEVIFKGMGKTLQQAIQKISNDLPTTKGVI